MLNIKKRLFLRNFAAFIPAVFYINTGKVFADWPKNVFSEKNTLKLIKTISDNNEVIESENIFIKAPDIAENGAVVPVTVSTDIANVKKISILVENNPSPLTSSFLMNEQLSPYVSTRVKMAATSNITAIVTTDDGYFKASRNIKVTIGGCGG